MAKLTFLLFLLAAISMSGGEESVPGRVLNLAPWKLTLPEDTPRPGNPDEITAETLQAFSHARYFHVSGDAVLFRAHCGGATTRGSRYPRCELRQMSGDGQHEAAWSTDDHLTHRLHMQATITELPLRKQHVVCAQIHDANGDLLMIRLEGSKLFVERKPADDVMLDQDYRLGTPFDIAIAAGNGRIQVHYNGTLRLDWPVSREGCYFKAGCYTQSSVERGDAPDAGATVLIRSLQLNPE